MSRLEDREPPREVRYTLEEALTLLANLEDARNSLLDSGDFAVLVGIEDQIRLLSRRLGFDDPEGAAGAR